MGDTLMGNTAAAIHDKSSDTPLTDALAPLVRKDQLARCRCGDVVPKMEWVWHWRGCYQGGSAGETTDKDVQQFLDYLRYFERRNGGPLPLSRRACLENGWPDNPKSLTTR